MYSNIEIFEEWKNFQNNKNINTNIVKDYILQSWIRSKMNFISPDTISSKIVSNITLDKLKKNYHIIINCIKDITKDALSENKNINITLASNTGVIIYKSFPENSHDATPYGEGNLMLEEIVGTNAISVCIKEQKTIQICGSEHFCKEFHGISCCATAIYDLDKNLYAVLCISSYLKHIERHSLNILNIFKLYIERTLYFSNTISNYEFSIDNIHEGVIIFSSLLKIKYINKSAIKLLCIDTDITDSYIFNFITLTDELNNIIQNKNCSNIKINLFINSTTNVRVLKVFLSHQVNTYTNDHILSFSPQTKQKQSHDRIKLSTRYIMDDIIGESHAIRQAKSLALRMANSDANILIYGETGTGKEVFAQAIHNASPRSAGPFIAVNCGALPRELVQSILFGYEPGAFTGAKKEGEAGKFELADGGTIFLDEIGEMPIEVQVNLLRVLQEKQLSRIGSKTIHNTNVRIIAATNKNLYYEVNKKTFRKDLFYRLNVYFIHLPSLKERREDILLLLDHFLLQKNSILKSFNSLCTQDCIELLNNYDWPGNIRELENFVERIFIYYNNTKIDRDTLFTILNKNSYVYNEYFNNEYQLICESLELFKGNIVKASQKFGCSRATFYNKIQRYSIDINKYRK